MKNKIQNYLIYILLNLLVCTFAFAEDLKFEANSIEILDKDRKVIAENGVKIISGKDIVINADTMDYDKVLQILNASGNITVIDSNKNIKINSDKLNYDKKEEKLVSSGNVVVNLEERYFLKTQEVIFEKDIGEINIKSPTEINDNYGNFFKIEELKYLIKEKLLKTTKIKIIDIEKNEYRFTNAIIDFSKNKFIGDGVEIDFFKNTFGDSQNDPRLKGNYVLGDGNKTLIKKGVFTTCKKNNDCPPWQLKAQEIEHNKEKKIINYKNAWLEIYEKPIFYFPKFFHPDPTVKRQSGFLIPEIIESSNLGMSVKVPYYKVISENKDFTFSPRIFSKNEGLFQNEYRQVNENSSHVSDFSIKKKGSSSKTHFFSNTLANLELDSFEISELEVNLEATSHDTYLKSHKISSEITSDQSLLDSFIIFRGNSDDLSFEAKLQAFEDLTKDNSSDKYEFLFPSFNFSKNFSSGEYGNIDLVSNGFYKNFQTNIFEKVLINDLKYSSDVKISTSGFLKKFNILLKNVTSEGKNSSDYKNDVSSENYGSLFYDLSYPMKKSGSTYDSLFTAKSGFMFSPNSNKNSVNLDRKINIGNIFSQNRLAFDDSVEGGESLTLGGEYRLRNKKNDNDVIIAGLASVLRDNEENNLPSKSTINNKGSDLVGSLTFTPTGNLKFDYNFSIDNDFESTNYNLFKTDISVNKFVTSFEFLQEDDEIGSESYLANETKYKFNNFNSLKYRTRRNKKTDFTEFYNLIYEYKNDCLKAAIQYNKDYYSDNDIKPTEELFFSISIIPFTSINTPSAK